MKQKAKLLNLFLWCFGPCCDWLMESLQAHLKVLQWVLQYTNTKRQSDRAGALCRQVLQLVQVSVQSKRVVMIDSLCLIQDYLAVLFSIYSACELKQRCKDQAHSENKPRKTNPVTANISKHHSAWKTSLNVSKKKCRWQWCCEHSKSTEYI